MCFSIFTTYTQSSLYRKEEEDFPTPKPMDCKDMSDFYIPWTVNHQAPLSMRFPRQFWSGLPFPSPGDLPDPGIKPWSPALAGRFFTTEPPGKPQIFQCTLLKEYCRCFNFTGISFVINTHKHTYTNTKLLEQRRKWKLNKYIRVQVLFLAGKERSSLNHLYI